MKIAKILLIVGLIMSPVIGLAQTSSTQTSSTKVLAYAMISPIPPAEDVTPVQVSPIPPTTAVNPAQVSPTSPATNVVSPQTTSTTVTSSQATSTNVVSPQTTSTTVTSSQATSTNVVSPQTTSTTVTSSQTTSVSSSSMKCGVNTFKVYNDCGIGAYKNVYVQCYDGYETNLGAVESSCKSADTWNQYAKEACANHCSVVEGSNIVSTPTSASVPTTVTGGGSGGAVSASPTPTVSTLPTATENKSVAVLIDRCNEVTQWENKISYYKKLSGSSDVDLAKGGFSRAEIERILQELSLGLNQVMVQCGDQKATINVPATATTTAALIAETVRPVVVESWQEIITYYKAELEKVTATKGEEKQIEELKTLRDEIDGFIANLIKSRTEVESAELNTLVKEVKVSQGEIKADDIVVKTTGKKILVNIGASPVSVEPTASQVIIRDKGLEVKTDDVTIKGNVLSVGGVDVKMSASETANKLNIVPKTTELKEENAKAVYTMKIEERRKLFGFIPLNIKKTVVTDAENGYILSEQAPWYNFLTTK